MPVYEHRCDRHGVFCDLRTFARSADPAACPECGHMCERIMSVVSLRAMDPGLVEAHDRNAKSKVEPHVCGSGCRHPRGSSAKSRKAAESGAGMVYKGPRPWVIEHA